MKKTDRALLFGPGDLNAFFGLVIDNMTQLVIMATILTKVFEFPRELVYYKMLPGSAIGVFAGDLAYTIMAIRLARKTGRQDVTAMPLGIDTPSLFAFLFGVIGPAYLLTKDPVLAWKISTAGVVIVGLVKTGGSFLGPLLQRAVPRAGLLGPIAGVALMLIAFLPLIKIFHNPLVGFVSLIVILTCIIGKVPFPFRIPAAFGAVLLGTMIYYITLLFGNAAAFPALSQSFQEIQFTFPTPTLDFLEGIPFTLAYLPLTIPFAIVVIIGGIDVSESAAAAGDHYDTQAILLTSGLSTLLTGLCGGVVQTTPYIGHPAYKAMGGRAGYTLWTALFIGLGGIFGYLGIMVDLIPEAALAPILIFIGLEITSQAFSATPPKHHKAVAFAFLPAVAALLLIELNALLNHLGKSPADLHDEMEITFNMIVLVANGFIISSLLWGAGLSMIIDRNLKRAAVFFGVAGGLSLGGIIHSPYVDGRLFFPWQIETTIPFLLGAGYFGMMFFLFVIDQIQKKGKDWKEPPPQGTG
ncbi:MAG: MFS transporter [Nitrospiria bacterium]